VLSLHAIPLKDEKAGDTYRSQVAESARLVSRELGIDPDMVTVSYQSVFGHRKDAWVSPLSLDILESWRDEDFRVVYCCMGFAIDCLETLFDIPNEMVVALEGEGAAPVVEHVGASIQDACNTSGRFVWVPTLNDSEAHVAVVRAVLDKALNDSGLPNQAR
jgi:ferrochelatase